LIFVTGQQEVQILCKKLRNAFPLDRVDAYKDKIKENTEIKRKIRNQIKLKDAPKLNLDAYLTIFKSLFHLKLETCFVAAIRQCQ
jgi:hypothetical protein